MVRELEEGVIEELFWSLVGFKGWMEEVIFSGNIVRKGMVGLGVGV